MNKENKKNCIGCGIPTDNPKYCSIPCYKTHRQKNYREAIAGRKCLGCGELLNLTMRTSYKTFCSSSCAAKVNNRKYPKRVSKYTIGGCNYCGEKLCSPYVKYCSRKCSGLASKERLINAWKEDPAAGTCKEGLKSAIRTYLIAEAGSECSLCGWSGSNPFTGKTTLQVDHLDGNSQNNIPENLQVLCPNCHSLTATYGSLNRGNGRAYRYKK